MTKARTLADNFAADINGITASAPLTGGGTSGTVTVGIQAGTTAQSGAVQLTDSTASTSTTTAATPNSVKSAYDLANGAIAKSTVDAKGDLLVGTANDTIGRLAVASTAGYLLTVDSAEATGLKWSAPAASGGMTLLETLSLSGSSTTSSTIPGTYKHLHIQVRDVYFSANDTFYIRLNNDTGSNYWCYGLRIDAVNSSIAGQYDTGVTVFTLCDLGNNSGALTRGVGSFWLWRYTDTSNVVKIDSTFNGYIAGNYRSMYEQGFYDNSAAITSITFRAGTGSTTFTAGTAYIYGVN